MGGVKVAARLLLRVRKNPSMFWAGRLAAATATAVGEVPAVVMSLMVLLFMFPILAEGPYLSIIVTLILSETQGVVHSFG